MPKYGKSNMVQSAGRVQFIHAWITMFQADKTKYDIIRDVLLQKAQIKLDVAKRMLGKISDYHQFLFCVERTMTESWFSLSDEEEAAEEARRWLEDMGKFKKRELKRKVKRKNGKQIS